MTDNIKPDHYRKGEIDLYEAFSQIFPHNEYRAGMQMIAMRYMFRDKIDRVEDLGKSIYTLERLKEKEIEHREKQEKVKSNKTLKELFADMGKDFGGIDFDEWLRKQKISELLATNENGGENGKVEQEPRYYAKIKGWEQIGTSSYYFGYDEDNDSLEVTYLESNYRFAFSLTKKHWNKLGINDTNADFEAVE